MRTNLVQVMPVLEVNPSDIGNRENEIWLERLTVMLYQTMADPGCTADTVARRMQTGRSVFYRRFSRKYRPFFGEYPSERLRLQNR